MKKDNKINTKIFLTVMLLMVFSSRIYAGNGIEGGKILMENSEVKISYFVIEAIDCYELQNTPLVTLQILNKTNHEVTVNFNLTNYCLEKYNGVASERKSALKEIKIQPNSTRIGSCVTPELLINYENKPADQIKTLSDLFITNLQIN